jgi:hypothetical protein
VYMIASVSDVACKAGIRPSMLVSARAARLMPYNLMFSILCYR